MHSNRPIFAVVALTALSWLIVSPIQGSAQSIAPDEARTIAKDAYIYGFPLVDNYRILYPYLVDDGSQKFKVPWNELRSSRTEVFAPENEAVLTPPSDMPYSEMGADLSAEPLVVTMPVINRHRHNVTQVIDLYSFNLAYIGSRTTDNDGGSFLVAGARWAGEKPKRIKDIIRPGMDFVFVLYRIEAFSPGNMGDAQPQAGYKVQGLHKYLGKSAPRPPSKVDFMKPISADEERTSLRFFDLLNFLLRFCPPNTEGRDLMGRFARLGIGPQADFVFNSGNLSPEMKKALEEGETDGWRSRKEDIRASSAGEELAYSVNLPDAAVQRPNNASTSVAIFVPAAFPLVSPFRSLATYDLPFSLFVASSPNRYLIDGP